MLTILLFFVIVLVIGITKMVIDKRECGECGESLIFTILGSLCAIFAGFVISAIGYLIINSVNPKLVIDNPAKTYQLEAISDTNYSEGTFILFVGGFSEELAYNMLYKEEDGKLTYLNVEADEVRIDTNYSGKPKLELYDGSLKGALGLFFLPVDKEYILYISEEQLNPSYNIDLE